MDETYAPKLENKRGQSISIKDIQMHYEEYGVGNPLVLLHGFGGCTQNWHPFIVPLSKHFRLILVDLRGHGYSTNPNEGFTHQEAAEDVFLLLEKLGISNYSAMGMSTGGMVLLHMATQQPKRIEALVLISATTRFPEQARGMMRRTSFETMPAPVKEMYRECAKRGEEQIRQLLKQFNAFHENHDDMNFDSQSLSLISARTLVIHGERDVFFPIDMAHQLSMGIPNATLWVVPQGEHVPIFDSNVPFTTRALAFLTQTDII